MKNYFLKFIIIFAGILLCTTHIALGEEDDWQRHLDVYNDGGLDRPVNAVEFQKTMNELKNLKDKVRKNQSRYWIKKGKELPAPSNENAPVKPEKNDIVKIVNQLYFDGQILQPGFYKIACEENNGNYYITFLQGKTPIMKIKAVKTSHMSFCPDKVSCIETEIYQEKYFKVNFKTIDYAVSAYLTIVEN